MIRQAKWAAADYVKFQLGWKEYGGGYLENYKGINYISDDTLDRLIQCAKDNDITILFSVFNNESYIRLLNRGFDTFKIASRTLVDEQELIEKMIAVRHTLYISLGMIENLTLKIMQQKLRDDDNIHYLWCKSKYPTFNDDLKEFPEKFNHGNYLDIKGYSDHCIGIDTCLLAIARGATIIEKHFTMNKYDNTHHDHLLSAEPDEFKTMVQIGREINKKVEAGI